jgi:hypothetical protein
MEEHNMKYLLMIYSDEAADAKRPAAEHQEEMKAYFAYTEEVKNAGALRGAEPALRRLSA